ncbi:regulatory protein RecX [Hephaestia sp. GCM10023244]|uniref:regulatory protein RecX n=1 Tax=unclassified Hephaestia TaxID=2631281 RepID=UPI0020778CAF|nr:RecX family transcriptional regulator [Hephaestia sp. MAHUQ-44]MCM8730729.1 RecX family transcriptional regulator [Hephaestia sp. MAHUQ-44]
MPGQRRSPKPLDAAALDRLALRYVERFATTRARLATYLARKMRERGWEGAPIDPVDVAERMAALGYIDDRAFAEARARSMTRRGLGGRRVAMALHAAGVAEEDSDTATAIVESAVLDAALAFARRRRIGPFAPSVPDRPLRERHLAAMIRGGHDFAIACRIVAMAPGEEPARPESIQS